MLASKPASSSAEVFRKLLPVGVGLLALVFGVIHLNQPGFFGDEYNSLVELTHPGLQPHGAVFFALLRLWKQIGGDSLEWLRLLSAIFAALSVPILYGVGWLVAENRLGALGVALVAATAAWRVEEGQEVRFYAYFILTAAFLLLTVMRFARSKRRDDLAWMVIAALLTASAHLLGIIFVVVALVFGLPWASVRVRWGVLGGVVLVASLLTAVPTVLPSRWLQMGYRVLLPFESATHANTDYNVLPRGASLGTLIKPVYAFYSYTLGTSFYPLDLRLSLPALIITLAAIGIGIWQLGRQPEILLLLAAWFIIPIVVVLLAFDSLAPPGYVSTGAHHIAPAGLAVWIVVGLLAPERRYRPVFFAMLAVNVLSLGYYYTGDWSLNGRKDVDLRAAAVQANRAGCGEAMFLVTDGRMQSPAQFYAAPGCTVRSVYEVLADPVSLTAQQVGVWYASATSDKTAVLTLQQALITKGYTVQDRWQSGLVAVETYRLHTSPQLSDGQLSLPWSQPPLYFSSLHLPVMSNAKVPILGAVVMQPGQNETWEITLTAPLEMTGLALTSSTFQMEPGAAGTVEAILEDGRLLTFNVINGQETANWAATGCTDCQISFGWRKRLDKLGRSAYPGAWQDFRAQGFATQWSWFQPEPVVALRFDLTSQVNGEWWVWQVLPTYFH
jgi:uncharacterized membrane protein